MTKTICYSIDSSPDALGRHSISGYWVGIVGRRLDTVGVRGQQFNTTLADFCRTPSDASYVRVANREEAERVLRERGELG